VSPNRRADLTVQGRLTEDDYRAWLALCERLGVTQTGALRLVVTAARTGRLDSILNEARRERAREAS